MILDDYYCSSCGYEEEVTRNSINEGYEGKCPKCGQKMIKKFNVIPISFKGNGWTKNNSQDLPSPRKTKADVGVKVDYDKKREMEKAGEI